MPKTTWRLRAIFPDNTGTYVDCPTRDYAIGLAKTIIADPSVPEGDRFRIRTIYVIRNEGREDSTCVGVYGELPEGARA